MPTWLSEAFEKSSAFMPHGHCYLWLPGLLWMHVISDALIGIAYVCISLILYLLVRRIRLPFSPLFIAFGLFIGLCGVTHFSAIWTVWQPDYFVDGLIKVATAAASVATAACLFYIRPQVEELVHTARLSEERRIQLETKNAELEALNNRISRLDELRSQFFANVSHELRTPLALVLGPVESLVHDDNLTLDQKKQLQSISRNGKTLLKQVNDLLDVAKLEEGKMQIYYARLDLVPWLRRITSQFDVAAEHRSIGYRLQTPDRLEVEADSDMLERVLINLLSNAFKFTPEGGEVRVSLSSDAKQFNLCVEDSGPGIAADQQEVIFERFRQIDGGATRQRGGTGLGLAIAREFITLHGGQIMVETSALGGALFSVTVPVRAKASATVNAEPDQEATSTKLALEAALHELQSSTGSKAALPVVAGRPSVLVVDDTREMNDFIATTLNKDYNVVAAFDGQEGLEVALALKPDLLVTDLMMPKLAGDELVAEIRTHSELSSMPILLLTAKTDDELRVKLLSSGAQDYLNKPFLPHELLARAGNLITMKQAGDALRKELTSTSLNVDELAQELAVKHRQLVAALELEEVAREQAERASQVKSQFLALISHEMRTPLSVIHMNAQMLERHKESQLTDAAKPRVERMVRATQQLTTLVEGVLEYTRVDSGALTLQMDSIDVLPLAREVIESAQLQVPSAKVKLTLATPMHDLPPFVTDPRLLRVVLNNLVSNALKFTSEGTVSLALESTGDSFVFEVRDTGIGIPEKDIPRIFLPFEQLEPIQRKSIPGVGLGLSLTKEIVEAMQGTVEVSSKPGMGSTFKVTLPSRSRAEDTTTASEGA